MLLTYFSVLLSVPWRLRITWGNCMHTARQMNVHISHIYKEDNLVADKLANYGANSEGFFFVGFFIAFPTLAFRS